MAAESRRIQLLFTQEEIAARVLELGARISEWYRKKESDKPLLVVGVLNGAFMLVADLVRALTVPVEVDFISIASYGDAQISSGRVTLRKDITVSAAGRDMLVVDDLVDSGLSLAWLSHYFTSEKKCSSFASCALLEKTKQKKTEKGTDEEKEKSGLVVVDKEKEKPSTMPDFVGFQCEHDSFVIGYGMDDAGLYRGLPYVGKVIIT